jgi:hypothetical protein
MRDLLRFAAESYRSVELLNNVLMLLADTSGKGREIDPAKLLSAKVQLYRLKDLLMDGINVSSTETKAAAVGIDQVLAEIAKIPSLEVYTQHGVGFQFLKAACETLKANLVNRKII